MALFSKFGIDAAIHPLDSVLATIEGWGCRLERTRTVLPPHAAAEYEGYRIKETDITIRDPRKTGAVPGHPLAIFVYLPYPATGYQEFDQEANKKLYNKIKRKFAAKW